MKNSLRWLAFLVLLSFTLLPNSNPEEIEAQISKVEGKEKITLLAELTKAYKRENPQRAIKYGKEALELLRIFPNKKLRVTILNNMSSAYRFLGEAKVPGKEIHKYSIPQLHIAIYIKIK